MTNVQFCLVTKHDYSTHFTNQLFIHISVKNKQDDSSLGPQRQLRHVMTRACQHAAVELTRLPLSLSLQRDMEPASCAK